MKIAVVGSRGIEIELEEFILWSICLQKGKTRETLSLTHLLKRL